ncbi:MAG: 16S rRNA (guanine(527)-N(7))-methyltransferase RsmG [Acidimicrobiales bacterium]
MTGVVASIPGWQASEELHATLMASRHAGFIGEASLDDHLAHAAGFAAVVEHLTGGPPGLVADLGSGGGLPALVLAEWWLTTQFVLIESQQRRAEFLHEVVQAREWTDRVTVLQRRAEEVGRDDRWRETFDVVTARSFGRPGVTAECAAPLLRSNGLLVVSEPPSEGDQARWPTEQCAELGLEPRGAFRVADRFGYEVLEQTMMCPERYPRRTGVPAKRPLF